LNSKKLNLLTCFNSSYAKYAAVSINSYLKHSGLNLKPIFAVDQSVSQEQIKIIKSIFPNCEFIEINRSEIESKFPTFQKVSKLDISAMYRIYAIKKMVNDLTLYVDVDTVCRGSLEKLHDYSDSLRSREKVVAACSHFRKGNSYQMCELDSPYLYFNSGVLMFYPKILSEFVNPDIIRNVVSIKPNIFDYADQSCMNYLLKGKVKWMEYIYNAETWFFVKDIPFYKSDINPLAELLDFSVERALKESKIIHFTNIKPWDLIYGSTRYQNEPQNLIFWIQAEKEFRNDYGSESLVQLSKC